MSYEVTVLNRAKADFRRIRHYLRSHSPQGAAAWADAFESAIRSLRKDPLRHQHAPEEVLFRRGIRQLLFRTSGGKPYRLLYLVAQDQVARDQVAVLRVRGHGQLPIGKYDLPNG